MGSSMTKGTGLPRNKVLFSTRAARIPTAMPPKYSRIITGSSWPGKNAAENRV